MNIIKSLYLLYINNFQSSLLFKDIIESFFNSNSNFSDFNSNFNINTKTLISPINSIFIYIIYQSFKLDI